MRVLIARINHETNTFSPIPTPLEAFGRRIVQDPISQEWRTQLGPSYGVDALETQKGQRTAMGAFIDYATERNWSITTPIAAWANPSGKVAADAHTHMLETIVEAGEGCDLFLLDLHGAMVAENSSDGEGDLIRALRERYPSALIAVALDLHGNVTENMAQSADILISYKTYPHIDMYETGWHVARLAEAYAMNRSHITLEWKSIPLMSHTLRSATIFESAMQQAVELAKQLEQEGALAVSVLAGFALADIPRPCVSVVVLTHRNRTQAQDMLNRLTAKIWHEKEGFVYHSEPMRSSLQKAQQATIHATRPVLVLDHGDNCNSGGTCDTTAVLEEALALGMQQILAGPFHDRETTLQAHQAGVGATISIALGNRYDLSFMGISHRPFVCNVTVRGVSEGSYVATGPTFTGMTMQMGKTAVLELENGSTVVVCESTHEPFDKGLFDSLDIDITQYKVLILKSRMYCRPVFSPLAEVTIECDSPGVTTSNMQLFRFTELEQGIYPLTAP